MRRAIALHPTDYNYGDLTVQASLPREPVPVAPLLRLEHGPRRHRERLRVSAAAMP